MKEIKITIPDNCELKQDCNTYTIVKKEKKLTYEDVVKELFGNRKDIYYIGEYGNIFKTKGKRICDLNNCTSSKQAQKLIAINKLMNVAKYLNGDWQPNWIDTTEFKYYLLIEDDGIKINYVDAICCADIYFKSREIAKKAIEILGKETIKLALCTDY